MVFSIIASDADAIMLKIILCFLPLFNLICQYFRKKQSKEADYNRNIGHITFYPVYLAGGTSIYC